MDNTTFGNFPSAMILCEKIFKNDKKFKSKIGDFIQDYIEGTLALNLVKDSTLRKRMQLLWRNSFMESVNFGEDIDTYVKNVIVAYYRKSGKTRRNSRREQKWIQNS